ncbi:MAG: serine/threonine-protein kinase [Rhodoglobus sp.]
MSDRPGRVGDYLIEAELGEGGMARVYRARHVHLDTLHAVKVLDPRFRANPDVRRRFLDEAKIQAKHLKHPGIVKVTNIVANDAHAALVMDLIEGPSLESLGGTLRQRPDELKRIMLAILDAVGHAHAAGIVHRDLKPANVLIELEGGQPMPKVTDFGIAKLSAEVAGEGKKSTAGAARMGTLGYMSPEQIKRAKDVTARSDIFSLGAMLYELATGAVPFDGDSDYDVMDKIVNGRYVAPERRYAGIDPIVAGVIKRALEREPALRYASCAEMAAALSGPAAPVAVAPIAPPQMPAWSPPPVSQVPQAVAYPRGAAQAVTPPSGGGGIVLLGAAIIVATVGGLAWVASKGDSDSNSTGATLAKFDKITDELCACRDMACAEGVMRKLNDLKSPKDSSKMSKAEVERAMKIAARMTECQLKLANDAMPPPPSPPPSPAELPATP